MEGGREGGHMGSPRVGQEAEGGGRKTGHGLLLRFPICRNRLGRVS